MGKKKPGTVPNRHMYSRISFLYQASAYLAQTGKQGSNNTASQGAATAASVGANINTAHNDDRVSTQTNPTQEDAQIAAGQNMSRRLLTDLRAVTHKSVIRASPNVKRSICKYCDTLLIDGQTSSSSVENKSKGGKKPWADVLVTKCHTCGGKKRFPVNPREQKRRPLRDASRTSRSQPSKSLDDQG